MIIILSGSAFSNAQDSTALRFPIDEGLTIQGGIGYLTLRDEYISDDKYSSTIPLFGVTWSKFHETYGFRLHLEYQYTSDLKGPNVHAELTQFRLALIYLYPLANARMFSSTVYFSLGPTVELFEHYQRLQIAGSAYLNSNIALLAGGLRSEAYWPLADNLRLRAVGQCTIVSLGGHSTDSNKSGNSPNKFLTPFSGIDAQAEIVLSWLFTKSLECSVGYRFNVTRVSAWDYFISANDNLTVSLSYGL